jgi:hypothetical protein
MANYGVIDLTGQRFGKLVVEYEAGRSKEGGALWLCRCDCGSSITTRSNQLRRGRVVSCGCARSKHGRPNKKIYDAWFQMVRRCHVPTCKDFKHYGARGIVVCQEWRNDIQRFEADMGQRPPGGTLERIDVDGPYSKDNCRWASQKEQTRNARSNIVLTYGGKSQCLGAWAEDLKLRYHTLYRRVVTLNWPLERALK